MSELEKQAMEYFVTKQFNHIINIRDFFQFQVFQVVVMDCADGQLYDLYNKAEFVNKNKQEKNQLFLQIIKGVEELHSLGLYHRDLKPENVVYFHQSNSYILKLCDFGLLKNTQDVFRTYNIGTPYYQAPELIDNNKAYNEKVDIWALGMMWFEMIAKKTMIDAFNKEQLQSCKIGQGYILYALMFYNIQGVQKNNALIFKTKPPNQQVQIYVLGNHSFFQHHLLTLFRIICCHAQFRLGCTQSVKKSHVCINFNLY